MIWLLILLIDDTDSLYIPAVFVSRASYLGLRDLLANQTDSKNPGQGLYIDITEGSDEGKWVNILFVVSIKLIVLKRPLRSTFICIAYANLVLIGYD